MSRRCTVCLHHKRTEIEREIVSGVPVRWLARHFNLSRQSLYRHRDHHLPQLLVQAKQAQDLTHADDLAQRFEGLIDDAQRIRTLAEKHHDYRAALVGLRDIVRINEILLEVRGELNRNPQVNVMVSSQWLNLRTAILLALEPYPEARRAAAKVLSVTPQSVQGVT